MKKLNLLFVSLLSYLIFSCSTNDNNEQNQINGSFKIGNLTYNMYYAYINDENIINDRPSDLAIILSNVDLTPNNISSGIDYIYVDYRGINFEIGSKEVLDHRITEDASRVNGYIEGGNKLLDNAYNSNIDAIEKNFIINSISPTNIDVEFSFTREDGEIISGNYSGKYTNVSN